MYYVNAYCQYDILITYIYIYFYILIVFLPITLDPPPHPPTPPQVTGEGYYQDSNHSLYSLYDDILTGVSHLTQKLPATKTYQKKGAWRVGNAVAYTYFNNVQNHAKTVPRQNLSISSLLCKPTVPRRETMPFAVLPVQVTPTDGISDGLSGGYPIPWPSMDPPK